MSKVLLVGSGPMAIEYYKVLKELNIDMDIVGRGESSALNFEKITGKSVIQGGLKSFEAQKELDYSHAIIAVGVEQLSQIAECALHRGIKNILIEKPGGYSWSEIESLESLRLEMNAKVKLAYNRRFYDSVLKAKELIKQDGGAISAHFEFTELSHRIEKLDKSKAVLEWWLMANSSHIIDLTFSMIGWPKELTARTSGELVWHPPGGVFTGLGLTEQNVQFSYHSNWLSPGRWAVEILTSKNRFIFKPIEKLQVIPLGKFDPEFIEDINYQDEESLKPGLKKQVIHFLDDNEEHFLSLENFLKKKQIYNVIQNGGSFSL